MLALIPDMSDHTISVTASGMVTATDYEAVLIPAVEAAFATHGKVRVLYHLGPSFSGFTPGAMWDDMKMGLAHIRGWQRIAVVTDLEWIAGATRLFGFAMPCETRVFSNRDLGRATEWIGAD
ncbi:MAG TPA: STAS/SEC14 domain-containing protein [Gemmatimonadaceae bacterium]